MLAYTIAPGNPIPIARSNSFTAAAGSLSGSVASAVKRFARSARTTARVSLTRLARYADCFGSSIVVPGAVSDAPTPTDVLTVRKALSLLPVELRTLLELGYFGGMSSAEIAEHEQLAIGTVKSRVARALAELRESLRQS